MRKLVTSLIKTASILLLIGPAPVEAAEYPMDVSMQANKLMETGDLQGAVNLLKSALVRFADDNQARILFLNNLATVYDATGNFEQAETSYRQALTLGRTTLSNSNPDKLKLFANLIALYLQYGQFEKGERVSRELDNAFPGWRFTKFPVTARLFDLSGGIAVRNKRYPEAEELLSRAAELFSTLGEVSAIDRAANLNNLATVYSHTGPQEKALKAAQQAYQFVRPQVDVYPAETAGILANLALMEGRTGRSREAEEHFSEALTIARTKVPRLNPTVIMVYLDYGQFLHESGRKREGKQMQRRAAEIVDEIARGTSIRETVDYQSFRSNR